MRVGGRILATAMLAAFVTVGCAPGVGRVSGTISFDGKPLPSGTVAFINADGSSVVRAAIKANGNYVVDTVPVGRCRITVQTLPPSPSKFSPPPGYQNVTFVPIPMRYADAQQSGLVMEVAAGAQTHNIDLVPDAVASPGDPSPKSSVTPLPHESKHEGKR